MKNSMKIKKALCLALATLGLIGLSSCQALFSDDDLSIYNSFNSIASIPQSSSIEGSHVGDIPATENENTPNAYCFKSVGYAVDGKIVNTYKEGGVNHVEYNVNGGEDYSANKSSNNYDLYVPKDASKNSKHTVVLFIHGGAWVSGFKTDVNEYVYEFANRGYISATIKYTLLKKTMDDPSLSIFRNLDEIDACIASIKSVLAELGFDTSKTNLVIGGASSGAHLTMLYAYSRGASCPLPIKFLIDAVGPVDIKPENWKKFASASDEVLDAGLSASAIDTQRTNGNLGKLRVADDTGDPYYWNDYQTMRIANGMCGLPYTQIDIQNSTDENKESIVYPNEASNSMTKAGGGEDQLSVTYWMNASNKLPVVAAYAGKDSVVGIAQFAKLEEAFIANGYSSSDYDFVYFRNGNHTDISKEKDATKYNEFVNKIMARLTAI